MKRDGCHECGEWIDFARLDVFGGYPRTTPYKCSICENEGVVYSGTWDGNFWDTAKEVIAADDAARYAKRGKVDEEERENLRRHGIEYDD